MYDYEYDAIVKLTNETKITTVIFQTDRYEKVISYNGKIIPVFYSRSNGMWIAYE